jgi:hypothetical protein
MGIGWGLRIHKECWWGNLGKNPVGRQKKCEDIIKMYLRDIGGEDRRWMRLSQDHVLSVCSLFNSVFSV